jgi:hypothetical protein
MEIDTDKIVTKILERILEDKDLINKDEHGTVLWPEEYKETDSKEQLSSRVESGYVEFEIYKGESIRKDGYFCGSCSYWEDLSSQKDGHLGWCKKFQFSDRDYGCCNGWEAIHD